MNKSYLIIFNLFFVVLFLVPTARAVDTWEQQFFNIFGFDIVDYGLSAPKYLETEIIIATSTDDTALSEARTKIRCVADKYRAAFLREELRAVEEELAPYILKLNERKWTADNLDMGIFITDLDKIREQNCASGTVATTDITVLKKKIKDEGLANYWRFLNTALDKLNNEAKDNSARKIELSLAEERTRQQDWLTQKGLELKRKMELDYEVGVPADKQTKILEQFDIEIKQAKSEAEAKLRTMAEEKYTAASSTDASWRLLNEWSATRAKLGARLATIDNVVKAEREAYFQALITTLKQEAQTVLDAEAVYIKDGLGSSTISERGDLDEFVTELKKLDSAGLKFNSSLETVVGDEAALATARQKFEQEFAAISKRVMILKKTLAPAICRSRFPEMKTIQDGLDTNIKLIDDEAASCRDSLSIGCIDRWRFYYSNIGIKKEMSRVSALIDVASSTCAVGGEKDAIKVTSLLGVIRNEVSKIKNKIVNREDARILAQSNNALCRSVAPVAGLELNQTKSFYYEVLVNWQEQCTQKGRLCLDGRVNERVDFFRKNASSTESDFNEFRRQCNTGSVTQRGGQFDLDSMLLGIIEAKKLVLDIFAQRNTILYCSVAEDIYAAAISRQAAAVGTAAKNCDSDCVASVVAKKETLQKTISAAAVFNQKCRDLKANAKPGETMVKEMEVL